MAFIPNFLLSFKILSPPFYAPHLFPLAIFVFVSRKKALETLDILHAATVH